MDIQKVFTFFFLMIINEFLFEVHWLFIIFIIIFWFVFYFASVSIIHVSRIFMGFAIISHPLPHHVHVCPLDVWWLLQLCGRELMIFKGCIISLHRPHDHLHVAQDALELFHGHYWAKSDGWDFILPVRQLSDLETCAWHIHFLSYPSGSYCIYKPLRIWPGHLNGVSGGGRRLWSVAGPCLNAHEQHHHHIVRCRDNKLSFLFLPKLFKLLHLWSTSSKDRMLFFEEGMWGQNLLQLYGREVSCRDVHGNSDGNRWEWFEKQ